MEWNQVGSGQVRTIGSGRVSQGLVGLGRVRSGRIGSGQVRPGRVKTHQVGSRAGAGVADES